MRLAVGEHIDRPVDSGQYWNTMQIEMQAGETYEFTVNGKQYWNDAKNICQANGYNKWYFLPAKLITRKMDAPLFCLIGSIDKGNLFAIGLAKQYPCKKSGSLYCFANDVALEFFYKNNSGVVWLTIKRLT